MDGFPLPPFRDMYLKGFDSAPELGAQGRASLFEEKGYCGWAHHIWSGGWTLDVDNIQAVNKHVFGSSEFGSDFSNDSVKNLYCVETVPVGKPYVNPWEYLLVWKCLWCCWREDPSPWYTLNLTGKLYMALWTSFRTLNCLLCPSFVHDVAMLLVICNHK